jgi:hypothetical protein
MTAHEPRPGRTETETSFPGAGARRQDLYLAGRLRSVEDRESGAD